MTRETGTVVVLKKDLADENFYKQWDDPDGIAQVSPEKRKMLLSNPLCTAEDPFQILGLVGRRVVGRVDLIPGRFRVDGRQLPVLWGAGLFVSPEYRRIGMGGLLLRCWQELAQNAAGCGFSQMAYPLYKKMGWIDFAMERYVLLRRSRAVVEKCSIPLPLRTMLRSIADAALWLQGSLLSIWTACAAGNLCCREAEELPDGLDAAIADPHRRAGCHRSAAWIKWLLNNKTTDDPRNRQRLLLVHDKRGNPVAYFIIKVRFYETATRRQFKNLTLASLQDWVILDESKIRFAQLVLLAVREMRRWDPDGTEIILPEANTGLDVRCLGLLRAGQFHIMIHPRHDSPLQEAGLQDKRAWRIRPAEGDNFFA